MRTIPISTDVFAALWAKRQPGEDSENAILERLLGLPKGPPIDALAFNERVRIARFARHGDGEGGIYNRMFDVRFPPGFEIFRTYKGRDYSATVRDGRWVMDSQSFPSLFALSTAIIDSKENPWMNWKYRDAKGRINLISVLRKIPPEIDETPPTIEGDPKTSRKGARRGTRRPGPR